MKDYDPSIAPDVAAWLEMDESERLEMVREYHRRQRIKLPDLDAHAVTHAVIENQLADGLDRHEAVHALGSVLMWHIWNLKNEPRGDGDANAPYLAALDRLTAASWRNSG